MLKLIVTLPQEMNPELFTTVVQALTEYKAKYHSHFKIEYGDYGEYGGNELSPGCFFGEEKASYVTPGKREYYFEGYEIDVFTMERLAELQTLIPFEMHFENRGKYEPFSLHGYEAGEIYDDALNGLYYTEPKMA